jgi:hypothetical protein
VKLATCIGCACDDDHACVGEGLDSACSWVRLDRDAGLGVCSACPGTDVSRWDTGDRQVRALRTILGNWQHFERVDLAPEAPGVQRYEMRRAFWAGAGSMLLLCSKLIGAPTAKKALLDLNDELKRFKPGPIPK